MKTISSFSGDYGFLSNFYYSIVEFAGTEYPTNEHAFQAAKTLDPAQRAKIRDATNPGHAKRLGRSVALRPDWEEVKLDIMTLLCRRKFAYGDMARRLMSTEDAVLVEGNQWGDKIWGAVPSTVGDTLADVQGNGLWQASNGTLLVGNNRLGVILMQIRNELNAEYPRLQVHGQN